MGLIGHMLQVKDEVPKDHRCQLLEVGLLRGSLQEVQPPLLGGLQSKLIQLELHLNITQLLVRG